MHVCMFGFFLFRIFGLYFCDFLGFEFLDFVRFDVFLALPSVFVDLQRFWLLFMDSTRKRCFLHRIWLKISKKLPFRPSNVDEIAHSARLRVSNRD